MLLKLLPYSPFEIPRTERLIVLENHLRRRSHGGMALRDYVEWLEQAGIKKPSSRRTLYEDLRRYADFCDDIEYGDNNKNLQLDSTATRDATAWLMGQAWVNSPLKPYLSSAIVRCMLLAMSEKAEVHFHYKKLRNPGEPWAPNPHWCIPLHLIPGTDAGYMEVFGQHGGRYSISISRVSAMIQITDKTLLDYPPLPPKRQARLTIKTNDIQLRERLKLQFQGFREEDRNTLILELDADLGRMTLDIIEAHLSRTRSTSRDTPHQKQYRDAEIFYDIC